MIDVEILPNVGKFPEGTFIGNPRDIYALSLYFITNHLINEIKNIATKNNSLERTALALLNRLHIMYNGILKNVFTDDMEKCITPEYLLKNKVIIDMSYIREKGSIRDIRFLMNVIVKFLLIESFSRGFSTLQNLLVIEEAQFLVPEIFYKRTSADFSTVTNEKPNAHIEIIQKALTTGFIN